MEDDVTYYYDATLGFDAGRRDGRGLNRRFRRDPSAAAYAHRSGGSRAASSPSSGLTPPQDGGSREELYGLRNCRGISKLKDLARRVEALTYGGTFVGCGGEGAREEVSATLQMEGSVRNGRLQSGYLLQGNVGGIAMGHGGEVSKQRANAATREAAATASGGEALQGLSVGRLGGGETFARAVGGSDVLSMRGFGAGVVGGAAPPLSRNWFSSGLGLGGTGREDDEDNWRMSMVRSVGAPRVKDVDVPRVRGGEVKLKETERAKRRMLGGEEEGII